MKAFYLLIALSVLRSAFAGTANQAPNPAPNPFNNYSSSIYQTPAQQREADLINKRWQEQQAAIASQKAYAQQLARNQKFAEAVSALVDERDDAVLKLKATYAPKIADAETQFSTLKFKAAELEQKKANEQAENAHVRAKQLFMPKDIWRSIGGKICNAKDNDWFLFTGKVVEVKTNGILVSGNFGPPLEKGFGFRKYFVENFPLDSYPVADQEDITADMSFVAHMGGKTIYQFNHTKIDLGSETVRRLDYGKIVASPPPDVIKKFEKPILLPLDDDPELDREIVQVRNQLSRVQQTLSEYKSDLSFQTLTIFSEYGEKIKGVPNVLAKQEQDRLDERKRALDEKTLISNQQSADKGEAYGLLRMGQRYRDGEGVAKDLLKARQYMNKAAEAGSPTAETELNKLSVN
jgi:hypothetical protein